ncbi:hypothetical protein ABKN59_008908 [Abortiporus biennis]
MTYALFEGNIRSRVLSRKKKVSGYTMMAPFLHIHKTQNANSNSINLRPTNSLLLPLDERFRFTGFLDCDSLDLRFKRPISITIVSNFNFS